MDLHLQHESLSFGEGNLNNVISFQEQKGDKKVFLLFEYEDILHGFEEVGQSMFSLLAEFLHENKEDDYTHFEEVLKKVNKFIVRLYHENGNIKPGHFNVAALVYNKGEVHFSVCGKAEVYLVRNRFVETISEGLYEENSVHLFSNIASGKLTQGDYLIFATQRMLRFITKVELGQIMHPDKGFISVIEMLEDRLFTEVLDKLDVNIVKVAHKSELEPSMVDNIAEKKSKITEDLNKKFDKVKDAFASSKDYSKSVKSGFSSLSDFFVNLFGSIKNLFTNINFAKFKREQLLVKLFVVLVVLVIGVTFLSYHNKTKNAVDTRAKTLTEVEMLIDNAVMKGGFSKEESKQMFVEAEEKVIAVLNSGYLRVRASELKDRIVEERDRLDKVSKVNNPKILVDLTSKDPDADVLGLNGYKDRVFAYGNTKSYEIVGDKVFDPVTVSDNNDFVKFGSYMLKHGVLVLYTSSGRVVEYANKIKTIMNTSDGEWKQAVALEAYGSRLYLLDELHNKIWKYTRERDKYGTAEPYNENGSLKGAVDLTIDSSVYILKSDGSVDKYYSGKKVPFLIKNAPFVAFKRPTKVFTTQDEVGLFYILDPDLNRVVVFQKTKQFEGMNYTCQIMFENLNELKDIYATEGNKLYLTDGKRVYKENVQEICNL